MEPSARRQAQTPGWRHANAPPQPDVLSGVQSTGTKGLNENESLPIHRDIECWAKDAGNALDAVGRKCCARTRGPVPDCDCHWNDVVLCCVGDFLIRTQAI